MAHALARYESLLDELGVAGFRFHPIRDYFSAPAVPPFVYLRHDVDRLPHRAVAMAEAEAKRGIRATYYFRCNKRGVFPRESMLRIAALDHEIGFHYESLSRAGGDMASALRLFEHDLSTCREIVSVTTVSPHGAPLSTSSNMDLASGLGLARLGLLGDATGIDFSRILYITDTGGTFGSRHNLRDRPQGRMLTEPESPRLLARRLCTNDEHQVVLSCHPERWPSNRLGLLHATAMDLAANTAKAWRTRLSDSTAY